MQTDGVCFQEECFVKSLVFSGRKDLRVEIYKLVPHFHIDVDFSFLANTILSFLSFTATIISVPSVQVTEGEGQS